jgi:hypothetical protein
MMLLLMAHGNHKTQEQEGTFFANRLSVETQQKEDKK